MDHRRRPDPLTVPCLWAVPDALMARFRERLPGLRFLAPGKRWTSGPAASP